MQLQELIADIEEICTSDETDGVAVTGLTADSREVRAGYIFAALPGAKADGRNFIDDALRKGAAAVLVPAGGSTDALPGGAALLVSGHPRRAFALLAARFYGPQMPVIAAVTGTNGKSSTVNFCRQIWRSLDKTAASLGTIGVTASGPNLPIVNRGGLLTTPDPVALHAEISELCGLGVTHLAFEASSIGIDQSRLDGVAVTAAAFTNLTRDHLDYHGTMEKYLAAKMRLFTDVLTPAGIAVINADAEGSATVAALCRQAGRRVISFGRQGTDIRLLDQKPMPHGQFIDIDVFGDRHGLELPIVGDFQALNALTALGLVLAESPDDASLRTRAIAALERLESVRGRLELAAQHPTGAGIYVDYAHTPDGLETMLRALRPHAQKKLHVVFGCGGDRDRGKRPMMGEIAARLADYVIVTDDNPRTEDAAFIRSEVMQGCPGATEIAGRRLAIRTAISQLAEGDLLVIAGKGHEQGQIVGKDVLPFDDVSEARAGVDALATGGKEQRA